MSVSGIWVQTVNENLPSVMDLIIRLNPIITCKFSKQLISTCSPMVYGSQYSDVNASKQHELPTHWGKCHCHLRVPTADFYLVSFFPSLQCLTAGKSRERQPVSSHSRMLSVRTSNLTFSKWFMEKESLLNLKPVSQTATQFTQNSVPSSLYI